MKILYVTTIGLTMIFFKNLVQELVEAGHTVDIATNESESKVDSFYHDLGCRISQVDFSRSPLSIHNITAYKQIKQVVSEGQYDIVHCHTPVAAAITRLACLRVRKKGTKVFYTAHGFHFYKGAPLKNWLFYYPIEKICSLFTDVLITINHEDYEFAKKKMWAKQVEYVPGVGIDVDKFANTVVDRAAKRKELGIPEEAFLLLSIGELNQNKNHQVVIHALAELKNPDIHYLIAGEGPLHNTLFKLAKELGVGEQVHLLGQRDDVAELYKTADAEIFPSIREGLGLAALEGMASGLPLICADNRGTREYAKEGYNAMICSNDIGDYISSITALYQGINERAKFGVNGQNVVRDFDRRVSNALMMKIYNT